MIYPAQAAIGDVHHFIGQRIERYDRSQKFAATFHRQTRAANNFLHLNREPLLRHHGAAPLQSVSHLLLIHADGNDHRVGKPCRARAARAAAPRSAAVVLCRR